MNLTSPNNLHVRYMNQETGVTEAMIDVKFAADAQWRQWTSYFDRSTARKALKRVARQMGKKAIVTYRADGTPIAKLDVWTGVYSRVER